MADFQLSRAVQSNSVDCMLSQLFRNIVFHRGIGHAQFNYLILSYLSHTAHGVPRNIKQQSNDRGNLRKQLLNDTMSWKVFYKGLWFLKIKTCDLIFTLEHANHRVTIHEITGLRLTEHSRPGRLLSNIFQDILLSLGISPTQLPTRLTQNSSLIDKRVFRTNLKNELLKKSLTWKLFCRGLWGLGVEKITLRVNLLGENALLSSHEISLIQMKSQIRRPTPTVGTPHAH
jgi:hypothetical protein